MDFLNFRLGVQLEPTAFHGDIHLSERERSAPSPIRELAGQDAPYWLVSAGGKHDLTIKWWAAERYQKVIDHFRERIQFVQVGQADHHHPHLDGVMDLRGRTHLRQLIQLIHNADGVLCGVTSLMHLAAAVPRPSHRPGLRPCVVIAGGREPPHWEAYPGHQFLHTVGALKCCQDDGCWKSRTRCLGDGAREDEPDCLCVDVIGSLPHCMHLITPEAVIQRIETYVRGGMARYLQPREARLASRAVRAAGPSGFDDLPLTLPSARGALEAFLRNAPIPPTSFRGRGVVICGGGARYFANSWVCLNRLRRLGCRLPIQLWHLGRHEMDPKMERLVSRSSHSGSPAPFFGPTTVVSMRPTLSGAVAASTCPASLSLRAARSSSIKAAADQPSGLPFGSTNTPTSSTGTSTATKTPSVSRSADSRPPIGSSRIPRRCSREGCINMTSRDVASFSIAPCPNGL